MTLGSEHFRDKRKITKEIATESWSHSPEETELRLKNFERFEAMTPEEFDVAAEGANLSEGEKLLLLSAGVGQGLFFAGPTHVAMSVVASPEEHKLITTNPAEVQAANKEIGGS